MGDYKRMWLSLLTKSLKWCMFLALIVSLGGRVYALSPQAFVGLVLEPPNLDPTSGAAGVIDVVTYANVFEGLTRLTSEGQIVPGLAESWTVSPDGTEFVFYLRQNVKFHDGSNFDAFDVKFTLERIIADDSINAQKVLYTDIKTVQALTPFTVKVTMAQQNARFLYNLALGDAIIVAEGSAENNAFKPIGTGAFRFKKWVRGSSITLERNWEYWGEAPYLEQVVFKFISDGNAAFAAIMSGEVDVFIPFPAPEILSQFKGDPRFQLITDGATEGEVILAINHKAAPFDQLNVRKALAHAIDRDAIIDGAMFGFGTPIGSHFPPYHPAYVDLTALSSYNPELSKKLLKEAGFPDGFTTVMKLPPSFYARRSGEIIAAYLRNVGIEVEVVNIEWVHWLEEVFKGKDFALTIVAHTESFDIDIYARPDYYFQYNDPEVQQTIKDLRYTLDEKVRHDLLRSVQKKIAQDYVNGYLFQMVNSGVADVNLRGFWKNAPIQAFDVTKMRWVEK